MRARRLVLRHAGSPSEPSGRDLLNREQRRLLAGVCIVVGAASTVPASYNFVVVPMLEGLGASEEQGSLLRELPSIAGLLVIFLAGILGRRWGERRFITRCGVLFTVGNAVVAVAPVMGVAVAGLVLESIGASGFIVVALALLSSRVSDEKSRASAFSTYATVGPVVYLVMPLLAGALLDNSSWRLVAALWSLSGVVILVASRAFLPAAEGPQDTRELLTPLLAGVLMVAAPYRR